MLTFLGNVEQRYIQYTFIHIYQVYGYTNIKILQTKISIFKFLEDFKFYTHSAILFAQLCNKLGLIFCYIYKDIWAYLILLEFFYRYGKFLAVL